MASDSPISNSFDWREDMFEMYRSARRLNQRMERVLDAQNDDDLLSSKTQSLARLQISAWRIQLQIGLRLERRGTGCQPVKSTPAEPPLQAAASPLPEAWKDDAALFSREGLGLELFPHQAQFCDSPKRINLLIAGRGAGKSEAARVKILHDACLRPNHLALVVSSSGRMCADFGSRLLDLLRESPTLDAMLKRARADRIALTNGSEIRLLPANPGTIRGFHPRKRGAERGVTLVLDEACFMPHGDEIRRAVEYVLISAPGGRLFIVSSPTSVESWVYGLVNAAQSQTDDVAVFQCGSAANPLIPAEEIERLRRSKNELEFRAEVLGEWVQGAYGLFRGLLEPNRLDAAPSLPPGTVFGLGVDLALSFSPTHDRNALAVVARIPANVSGLEGEPLYRLVEVRSLECASDRELREIIDQLRRRYPIAHAVIEQYQGKALAEHCESLGIKTELLAPTSANQRVAFHALHQLLRERRLQLPASLPQLFMAEMTAFQYRRGADGSVSFGHPPAGDAHDDTVYAAAWALKAALSATSSNADSQIRIPPIWC